VHASKRAAAVDSSVIVVVFDLILSNCSAWLEPTRQTVWNVCRTALISLSVCLPYHLPPPTGGGRRRCLPCKSDCSDRGCSSSRTLQRVVGLSFGACLPSTLSSLLLCDLLQKEEEDRFSLGIVTAEDDARPKKRILPPLEILFRVNDLSCVICLKRNQMKPSFNHGLSNENAVAI
jgi:hypothetical protein